MARVYKRECCVCHKNCLTENDDTDQAYVCSVCKHKIEKKNADFDGAIVFVFGCFFTGAVLGFGIGGMLSVFISAYKDSFWRLAGCSASLGAGFWGILGMFAAAAAVSDDKKSQAEKEIVKEHIDELV